MRFKIPKRIVERTLCNPFFGFRLKMIDKKKEI